jgi:hypothetical protein
LLAVNGRGMYCWYVLLVWLFPTLVPTGLWWGRRAVEQCQHAAGADMLLVLLNILCAGSSRTGLSGMCAPYLSLMGRKWEPWATWACRWDKQQHQHRGHSNLTTHTPPLHQQQQSVCTQREQLNQCSAGSGSAAGSAYSYLNTADFPPFERFPDATTPPGTHSLVRSCVVHRLLVCPSASWRYTQPVVALSLPPACRLCLMWGQTTRSCCRAHCMWESGTGAPLTVL